MEKLSLNKTSVLIRCNSNIQDFMYSLFNHLTVENSYSLTCTVYSYTSTYYMYMKTHTHVNIYLDM